MKTDGNHGNDAAGHHDSTAARHRGRSAARHRCALGAARAFQYSVARRHDSTNDPNIMAQDAPPLWKDCRELWRDSSGGQGLSVMGILFDL